MAPTDHRFGRCGRSELRPHARHHWVGNEQEAIAY